MATAAMLEGKDETSFLDIAGHVTDYLNAKRGLSVLCDRFSDGDAILELDSGSGGTAPPLRSNLMTLPPTPTTPTTPPADAVAGAEARRQIAAWIEDSCSQNNNIFQGLSSNLRIENDWKKALYFCAYEDGASPLQHLVRTVPEFLKRRELILEVVDQKCSSLALDNTSPVVFCHAMIQEQVKLLLAGYYDAGSDQDAQYRYLTLRAFGVKGSLCERFGRAKAFCTALPARMPDELHQIDPLRNGLCIDVDTDLLLKQRNLFYATANAIVDAVRDVFPLRPPTVAAVVETLCFPRTCLQCARLEDVPFAFQTYFVQQADDLRRRLLALSNKDRKDKTCHGIQDLRRQLKDAEAKSLRPTAEILRVTKREFQDLQGRHAQHLSTPASSYVTQTMKQMQLTYDEAQVAEKIALFTRRAADVRRDCLKVLQKKKNDDDHAPDDVSAAIATSMNDARRVLRGLEQQVAAFQKIKVKQAAAEAERNKANAGRRDRLLARQSKGGSDVVSLEQEADVYHAKFDKRMYSDPCGRRSVSAFRQGTGAAMLSVVLEEQYGGVGLKAFGLVLRRGADCVLLGEHDRLIEERIFDGLKFNPQLPVHLLRR